MWDGSILWVIQALPKRGPLNDHFQMRRGAANNRGGHVVGTFPELR